MFCSGELHSGIHLSTHIMLQCAHYVHTATWYYCEVKCCWSAQVKCSLPKLTLSSGWRQVEQDRPGLRFSFPPPLWWLGTTNKLSNKQTANLANKHQSYFTEWSNYWSSCVNADMMLSSFTFAVCLMSQTNAKHGDRSRGSGDVAKSWCRRQHRGGFVLTGKSTNVIPICRESTAASIVLKGEQVWVASCTSSTSQFHQPTCFQVRWATCQLNHLTQGPKTSHFFHRVVWFDIAGKWIAIWSARMGEMEIGVRSIL